MFLPKRGILLGDFLLKLILLTIRFQQPRGCFGKKETTSFFIFGARNALLELKSPAPDSARDKRTRSKRALVEEYGINDHSDTEKNKRTDDPPITERVLIHCCTAKHHVDACRQKRCQGQPYQRRSQNNPPRNLSHCFSSFQISKIEHSTHYVVLSILN